jgi:hypothetical protein
VIERNGKVIGIEVKSNQATMTKGMETFNEMYNPHKVILVGERGLPWEEFLKINVRDLF